ncbi:MAG: pseudouridine synthase [Alistipes sp.]|nr:pseudouridine synthase [Alistipes sp.]
MKRINKYITDAGYCSRREADAYISQGRVTINGRKAQLGDMVGDTDCVEVDGERVGRRKKPPVYIACNKPVGVTCTSERSDKTNIIDFLGYKERIFPVGRLDKDSEGLILLTNDGDIVNKILRAGNNNPKEYVVTVDKPITDSFLAEMGSGVDILGVRTKPCKVFRKNNTTFVIHLTQGLNRQIRRMCQALGFKVVRLKRIKVMNIPLGSLEPGRWRYLPQEEIREMNRLLTGSCGTEEASNEKRAVKARSFGKKSGGSFSQYRSRGKTEKRQRLISPCPTSGRRKRK